MLKNLIKQFICFVVVSSFAEAAPNSGDRTVLFEAKSHSGETVKLEDFLGKKIIVLEWTNMDCPFVGAHLAVNNIQSMQEEYREKGVIWLSVASSAHGKHGYYKAKEWPKFIDQYKLKPDHILLDNDGVIGKAYGARATPTFVIINQKGDVVYNGAIDDNPSINEESILKAKSFIRPVLDALLKGEDVTFSRNDSYGCSIKYK